MSVSRILVFGALGGIAVRISSFSLGRALDISVLFGLTLRRAGIAFHLKFGPDSGRSLWFDQLILHGGRPISWRAGEALPSRAKEAGFGGKFYAIDWQ